MSRHEVIYCQNTPHKNHLMFNRFRIRSEQVHFLQIGAVVGLLSSYFTYQDVIRRFPPPEDNMINNIKKKIGVK